MTVTVEGEPLVQMHVERHEKFVVVGVGIPASQLETLEADLREAGWSRVFGSERMLGPDHVCLTFYTYKRTSIVPSE